MHQVRLHSFVAPDTQVDMSSNHQTEHTTTTLPSSRRQGDEIACCRWSRLCLQRRCEEKVSCRTRSCRTTLTLKLDENCVYTDETPVHTHPPHETTIASLKRKKGREAAMNHRTSLVTTRSIATRVREENLAVRRLSTDLRFIRRFLKGNVCPKRLLKSS